MLFEVGERYQLDRTICEATQTNYQQLCTETIKPGYIYEIQVYIDPPLKSEDIPKMYDALKKLEEQYKFIGLNYIGVTDDGKTIIFQIFDPEESTAKLVIPIAIAEILEIIAGIITTIVIGIAIVKFTALGEKIIAGFPKPPSGPVGQAVSSILWIGIAVTVLGLGIYLIAKAVRGR
jgi:hypothetical protein